MEKMAWDGPKWGQEDFFLLIQTLPTFWAERIWNLRISTFFILWIQNVWISRSPDFPNLAWARPGLDLGGGGEMLAFHFRSTPTIFTDNFNQRPDSRLEVWGTRLQA